MSEITFIIEESPEGGYTAKALNFSIFTQGETVDKLKAMIKDAVQCHFEIDEMPKILHLHFVKDEVLAL